MPLPRGGRRAHEAFKREVQAVGEEVAKKTTVTNANTPTCNFFIPEDADKPAFRVSICSGELTALINSFIDYLGKRGTKKSAARDKCYSDLEWVRNYEPPKARVHVHAIYARGWRLDGPAPGQGHPPTSSAP